MRLVPLVLAFAITTPLAAQGTVDSLAGPTDTIRFTTTEGTWMNLDVSPDGRWIVFELLGDLYRLPIAGGTATRLTHGMAFDQLPRISPDGRTIVFVSDRSGADNLWLMDADGANPRALTDLTETLPTNPMWMPDGEWIVAKRHVRSTRSLGGGELWLFHLRGGDGVRLRERASFTSELNEPYPSADGRWVYYSLAGPFDYNRDPYAGIFQLRRTNRVTGRDEPVTQDAGGAVRPTVSPDGTRLAFVRRVGLKTALFVRDLTTGAERMVFDGLSRDQMETWVVHGSYPTFEWMPDGRSIVAWVHGGIHRIDIAAGTSTAIPFTADVEQAVTRALHFDYRVTDDSVRARMIRWPVLSPDGRTLVFQALGSLWRMDYPDGRPRRITTAEHFEYAPGFSADGRWLAYATWDEATGGRVMRLDLRQGRPTGQVVVAAPNQYVNPAFSPDGRSIAYVAGSGRVNRGADLSNEPFLVIEVVAAEGGTPTEVMRIASRGANSRMPRLSWSADGTRIWFHENRSGRTMLSSVRPDGTDLRHHADNETAEEMMPSPDGRYVAFKDGHQVYVAALPRAGDDPVRLAPRGSGVKVVQLSNYGGDWLSWRADGSALLWTLGPAVYEQRLDTAYTATAQSPGDSSMLFPGNARVPARITEIGLHAPVSKPSGSVVLRGARVITMRGDEVLERADVVVTDNRIAQVCADQCASLPAGARLVDVTGRTIMPGIVDVHAHMGYISMDVQPQAFWQYDANLAYGVTTTHDPSASTQMVFAQSELVAAGRVRGPRIYSTGFILYGAENANRAITTSMEHARAHLRRHHAVGGFSVKSYNQMRRDSRQWIIRAAREANMLVVPEGGSMYQQNITQVLDGHTGIEHAIPLAPLYRDALQLISRSGTWYTPTLVVGYGGVWGENFWYQESDVFRNERLRQFVPAGVLDARARRRLLTPDDDFYHITLAETARDIVRAGGHVLLGAHGQLQGLGAHWELWMFVQGGMTPLEAIRAATLHGAQYLGFGQDLGSIEPGKLADLIVLGSNPLENIRHTEDIAMVMANGNLYDADLNMTWPVVRDRTPLRFERR